MVIIARQMAVIAWKMFSEEILNRIVECCGFTKEDVVVEIGAGLGGLTCRLADKKGVCG